MNERNAAPSRGGVFLSAWREATAGHYQASQTRLNLGRMSRPPFRLIAALALTLAACVQQPAPSSDASPLVLAGEITRADHQTYREIPFHVPPGTQRITIDFAYTGKENRTVIDIGVRDPEGQRGWSGGNKSQIEIGAQAATPSYRAGTIQPGAWKLVLGIPNIRDGQSANYTATVRFSNAPDRPTAGPSVRQAATAPSDVSKWRRGDFHTHTAHSDGSCGPEGERGPCPTLSTFIAARDAGLDFVAVTDHNTITQLADIRMLQALSSAPLLIPGTEITTFNGHANVVGNTDFLDFQLGSPRLPTLAKLLDQVDAANAFISVNHPSLPSGEACMGCGWTVNDTDWSRITAIEVINGASMRTSGPEGAFNGIAFWEARLRQGHRITAIAGSDNHDATDTMGAKQSPVGTPTTVVYASEMSTQAIIAGVKSGRVFVDAGAPKGASFEMTARAASAEAGMGGELRLAPRERAAVRIDFGNFPPGAHTQPISHNLLVTPGLAPGDDFAVSLQDGASSGWFRVNIRDAAGRLLLLGNPIYLVRGG